MCNSSSEIPYFIEEDTEDSEKINYKLISTTHLENKAVPVNRFIKYKNNEILPVVILVQQTNLPPPGANHT